MMHKLLQLTALIALTLCSSERKIAIQCPQLCRCLGSANHSLTWNCENVTLQSQIWTATTTKVEKLILTNSSLQHPTWTVVRFSALKHLKIRRSQLGCLSEKVFSSFPSIETVDFDHSSIDCCKSMTWMKKWLSVLVNQQHLRCSSPETVFQIPLFTVVNMYDNLNSHCPKSCFCTILKVLKPDYLPVFSINCTYRNLRELPAVLPDNGLLELDLSNNEIENINPLVTNPRYDRISILILDENKINNVDILRNFSWPRYLGLLSLRGNQLTQMPTVELEAALRDNYEQANPLLLLGNNPWKCDCATTKSLQALIIKRVYWIHDENSVRCAASEGRQAGPKILNVKLDAVCRHPDEYFNNLFIGVYCCVSLLIIFIFSKTIYIYYSHYSNQKLLSVSQPACLC